MIRIMRTYDNEMVCSWVCDRPKSSSTTSPTLSGTGDTEERLLRPRMDAAVFSAVPSSPSFSAAAAAAGVCATDCKGQAWYEYQHSSSSDEPAAIQFLDLAAICRHQEQMS